MNKKINFHVTLSDSTFGKSCHYQEKDKILLKELGFEIDDSYFKKYFVEIDLKLNSFKNNDYKYYDKLDLNSTYIERFGINKIDEYKNFIKRQNIFWEFG